jgi:hypothetical protein
MCDYQLPVVAHVAAQPIGNNIADLLGRWTWPTSVQANLKFHQTSVSGVAVRWVAQIDAPTPSLFSPAPGLIYASPGQERF